MTMLFDGTAFCNWKNPPDSIERKRLVESLLYEKSIKCNIDVRDIEKLVIESTSEKELQRLISEMEIKEDDFKV